MKLVHVEGFYVNEKQRKDEIGPRKRIYIDENGKKEKLGHV
jgi:hypothetical protein